MVLTHGGQLGEASRRYDIPAGDWLDLSTGIAPWPYPVPEVPARVWARLPEADDGLIEAAAAYYRAPVAAVTALPGSQFAIRELPRAIASLTGRARVGVPAVGYAEHARAWQAAGHEIVFYADLAALRRQVSALDHAVVISPNNPTGEAADTATLNMLAHELGQRDGLLVLDAAFADCDGGLDISVLPDNVVVLRSVGKFFGLAGLRLGFMIGTGDAVATIRDQLAPWGVSHPARWIGRRALVDDDWQAAQRQRIAESVHCLAALLSARFAPADIVSAGLFASVFFDRAGHASAVHEALAAQAVLTRLGDNGRWLRFGLPADASARARLAAALGVGIPPRAGFHDDGADR